MFPLAKSSSQDITVVNPKSTMILLIGCLRLPQVEKGRSTSADILDDRGSSDDTRSAFSLPTSPSRRPLSSLTSPFTKASSPPQASGD